jgi:hypothetical protein
MAWFRPDGQPATAAEATALLTDGVARLLAQDFVHVGGEVIVISTLFTVFDHSGASAGRPLLWETTVAEGDEHRVVARYATRAEAEEGHTVFKEWVTARAQELSREVAVR